MKTIRAWFGALFVVTACFAAGCAAQVDDPAADGDQSSAPTTEQSGDATEHTGEAGQPVINTCMSKCIAQDPNDPYIADNCHCVCYGKPGKTCWLM